MNMKDRTHCPKCERPMVHITQNIWICRHVSCMNQGLVYGFWADVKEHQDAPNLASHKEFEIYGIERRYIKKVILTSGVSLHLFITLNFQEIEGLYKYLCILAKEQWGAEGWRKVDIELTALWVAKYRHNVNIKEIEN